MHGLADIRMICEKCEENADNISRFNTITEFGKMLTNYWCMIAYIEEVEIRDNAIAD